MEIGTEAVWQIRKVRLHAEGNGSLYCTVPASTSVVKGGFVEGVRKREKLPLVRPPPVQFPLVQRRSIGFELDTFGPSAEI
jgi:hypothetical protein